MDDWQRRRRGPISEALGFGSRRRAFPIKANGSQRRVGVRARSQGLAMSVQCTRLRGLQRLDVDSDKANRWRVPSPGRVQNLGNSIRWKRRTGSSAFSGKPQGIARTLRTDASLSRMSRGAIESGRFLCTGTSSLDPVRLPPSPFSVKTSPEVVK